MNGIFLTQDFTQGPFVLFGISHIIILALLVGLNLFMILRKDTFNQATQRKFRYGLAGILLVNEAAWHWWNWATGQWTIQKMLPLHLCSVLVFLSVYMLLKNSYQVYEYLYFLGIGGALQAVLTPDLGVYDYPHFRYFQTFISHGGIITAAIFMTGVIGYRPYMKSLLRVAVGANIYMFFVAGINTLIGSNYLFIAHKPETASLLDILPAWPWYIIWMEVIGLIVFLILYLPFYLRDRHLISIKL